ncbi:acetoacetate decarboxylase [Algoriphagus boseongensis]|uniref:Acetoacetate decarboxylase n=1 Tax=Algoriphagus boseongensis TaxID=1442587 RepID=A0A4R6T0V1_9BACT|nr:acetoacetate decarboxylase family protein [Algoriphagus boseongensis]TDQ14683.1 acetoacetate decarboxylase [Algoriphagus boseongensis]
MPENKASLSDLHLVKKAPAPWKLKGDGFILMFKFRENWVEDNGFLPESLKGRFRGGLGYVMLVNYTESPVGPYKELLFIPGKFRKSKTQCITKIYVDSECSTLNGQANWGIPKETLPFSWEKNGNTEEIKVLSGGKPIFSIRLKHGGIKFPVTTAILPIHLRQVWKKIKYYTKPTGTGWGKLAKIEAVDINPEFFPDFREIKPLLSVKIDPFHLEFPEPIFKDEIV